MQRLMCVAVMMALSGCATTPIPAEEADPVPIARLLAYQEALVDGATLIVTRDRGFTGSTCNTVFFINGKPAAEIGAGERATFQVLPDKRNIIGVSGAGVCSTSLKEREVSIGIGDVARYRISIDATMSMDLSPTAF